jgi:hypothetical protein
MAFSDNPFIDRYSEASEESVNATKPLFSQKNGFLVREETPDKGVDFDVELILEKQVSGFKFAIQLKSVQNLKTVVKNGTSYISYQFKTSRLGYLIRRKPGFGLLVIYDDADQRLYFDYVEDIYTRIMEEHENYDWQDNETVTVHINCNSILDRKSVGQIHEKMRLRHLRFNEMYSKGANDFDLPTFSQDELKDPLVLLEKYGFALFNEQNYRIIYAHLMEMTPTKILQNPRILLLAAITYYQMGYHADGEYYFRKSKTFMDQYSNEERALLCISKSSSDFSLGNIDRPIFVEELERHLSSVDGTTIAIFIRLKLLFLKLHELTLFEETTFTKISTEVEAISKALSEAGVSEEVRYHCLLEIASYLHEIGLQYFLKTTARIRIHKAMLGKAPFEERLGHAKVLIEFFQKPLGILESIVKQVKDRNEYLFAVVLFKKCYMMQSFMLQSLVSICTDEDELRMYKGSAPRKEILESCYREVLFAHDIFQKRMDYNSAYKCLTISMETNFLYSFIYSRNIDNELYEKAEAAINSLENDLEIPRHHLFAEDTVRKLVEKRQGNLFDTNYDLAETEKSQFVRLVIDTLGLPEERAENILYDIDFMRKASEAVNRKYFEVLQGLDHTKSKETIYREKPVYVIRCKGCGFETPESSDLDTLLQCLRASHRHICL